MVGKEAVIFVCDANYTMNASYPENSIWNPLVSSPPKEAPSTFVGDNDDDSTTLSKSNSSPRSSLQTRLSAGKEAILEFVVNLSWRSRQSEIGIVVLKTKRTYHHLYQSDCVDATDGISLGELFFGSDDSFCNEESIKTNQDNSLGYPSIPFPNLIELVPCEGISRPDAKLLSDITRIRSTIPFSVEKCNNHSKEVIASIQGDFCDGLILAADALYRRTRGKKFTRRIIMITDAEHEVHIDGEQLECVLGGLKKMDCSLGVIGIGFENRGEFGKGFDGSSPLSDNADDTFEENFEQNVNCDGDNAVSTIDIDEVSDNKNNNKNDVKNPRQNVDGNSFSDPELFVKRENEKLLISLAKQTGGWVAPANGECLATILLNHPSLARDGAKSRRTKAEFRIAPNLTVDVRTMYMTSSSKFPSLNKEIYQLDPESGQPLRDGLGEYLTYNIRRRTTYYDAEQPDVVVENITNAYPYGCDLIPVGKMDMLGIKAAFSSPACIEMLGYIAVSDVPIHLLIGPASAVVGGKESNKSRVTVASIAQAMKEKGVYGLCRFVKTDDAEPVLGVLIPKTDDDNDKDGRFRADSFLKHDVGKYLIVMQLPFAEDVQDIPPSKVPSDIYGDNNEATACDELIDSLILPDDEFRSTDISTPSIKCFERMVASNAMNPPVYDEEDLQKGQPMESILEASKSVPLCNFDAIKSLHEKAAVKAEAFFHAFPLKKMASLNGNDVNHTKKYWGDEN